MIVAAKTMNDRWFIAIIIMFDSRAVLLLHYLCYEVLRSIMFSVG